MDWLLFQPDSVIMLALLVLEATILGYLLSIRGKSRATWWLIALVGGLLLFPAGAFLARSIYMPLFPWPTAMRAVAELFDVVSLTIFCWTTIPFAYYLFDQPFPREARWVTTGAGLLTLLAAALLFLPALVDLSALSAELGAVLNLAVIGTVIGDVAWAIVVLVRKMLRARTASDRRKYHAYRAFALLNALPVLGLGLIFASNVGASDVVNQIGVLLFLGFCFAVAVVYVNHAPEPTSVQAKLIGLSLTTVLAALTVASMVLFQSDRQEQLAATLDTAPLRLVPDADGYVLERGDGGVSHPLGDSLGLGDDTTVPLALPFAFPFGGQRYDSVYVHANGVVGLGAPPNPSSIAFYNPAETFYNERPKIAPLFVDLDPSAGGGVFARLDSALAAITWHEVPRFEHEDRNTMQLVLRRDGTVEMQYGSVPASLWSGVRGVTLGGVRPARQAAAGTAELPMRLPGRAWTEDFGLTYRQRVDEWVRNLIWVVLGTAAFILLVFPFFFRNSLIKPLERLLEGMRRVNRGELETEVPVGVRDEIGYLTHYFNRTTRSLRSAEAALKAHADELEDRVEQRTRELRQKSEALADSLHDLKAMQAQLVQQEKMASLGQLTAGIAHEIKNPLNFVNNFAQLTTELVDELDAFNGQFPEETREEIAFILEDLRLNASKIEEHGRRADSIVKSMLQHSRGKAGECQPIDLNALVDEYVGLAYHGKRASRADFNAALERDYDDAVGEVDLVPQEIGRVLLNLLDNAFDAVYQHAVSTDEPYAPEVAVSTRRTSDEVEIRVTDNGPGIPEHIREKVFEPFFTTKPTGEGTGLGLSMSYDIVTQGHGGTMTVETAEGDGTTFRVTLPSQVSVTT